MKTYVKPVLYYEDLHLAQHIATCAFDINSTEDSCVATADSTLVSGGGFTIFAVTGCEFTPDIVERYCATNGEAGFNLYNS